MRRRAADDGFALFLVLVLLLVVSAGLALVAASLRLELELFQADTSRIKLTALADAALAESLARLAESASFPGLDEEPLALGRISSRVRRLEADAWRIEARASFRGRQRRVVADVRRDGERLRVVAWRRLKGADPGG